VINMPGYFVDPTTGEILPGPPDD